MDHVGTILAVLAFAVSIAGTYLAWVNGAPTRKAAVEATTAANNASSVLTKALDEVKEQVGDLEDQLDTERKQSASKIAGILQQAETAESRATSIESKYEDLELRYTDLFQSNTALSQRFEEQTVIHERDLAALNDATAKQLQDIRQEASNASRQYQHLLTEQDRAKSMILQHLSQIQNARDFLKGLNFTDDEAESILQGRIRLEDVRGVLESRLLTGKSVSETTASDAVAEINEQSEDKHDGNQL